MGRRRPPTVLLALQVGSRQQLGDRDQPGLHLLLWGTRRVSWAQAPSPSPVGRPAPLPPPRTHLVEGADRSITEGGLGGAAEKLEHCEETDASDGLPPLGQPGNPGAPGRGRDGARGTVVGQGLGDCSDPNPPLSYSPTSTATPTEEPCTCPPPGRASPRETQLQGGWRGGGAWAPETAGASSLALHPGRLTMAEAASYTTISCLLRRQLSMKSNSGLSRLQRNRRQEDAEGPPQGRARAGGGARQGAVPLPAVLVLQLPAGHADHHAVGEGGLEAVPRELADHLADGQAVVLPHVVQKPQRVVLGGWGGHRAGRVRPEATRPLLTSGVGTMGASGAQVWASRPSHGDSAGLLPPAPPGATQMEELETRCLQPERGSQSRPGLRTRVVRGRADWRPHSRPSARPRPRMHGCCCKASRGRGGKQTIPVPSALQSPH